MRILILSSVNPDHSAGLGRDLAEALTDYGHSVDFLTRYPCASDRFGCLSIFNDEGENNAGLTQRYYNSKRKKEGEVDRFSYRTRDNLIVPYPYEECPRVPVKRVVSAIKGKYDIVVSQFQQDMMTSVTLLGAARKTGAPLLLYSPDMAPMTGGCVYFGECRGFRDGCRDCPVFRDTPDPLMAARNFAVKRKCYSKMRIAFLGNEWTNRFVNQSGLFPKDAIFEAGAVMNETVFTPAADREELRRLKGMDGFHRILFMRSSAEPRKGSREVVQALSSLMEGLSDEERKRLLVITAGDSFIKENAPAGVKVRDLGFLSRYELIEAYRVADFFVSCSIDDAGPSMVNQSMLCGTPVIAFRNGVALTLVQEGDIVTRTGFRGPAGDVPALAENFRKAWNLTEPEYVAMRKNARAKALSVSSRQAVASAITAAARSMIPRPRPLTEKLILLFHR